jgi:hypothetical protein
MNSAALSNRFDLAEVDQLLDRHIILFSPWSWVIDEVCPLGPDLSFWMT